MILKNKDSNQDSVDYLSDLLARDFPEDKKRLIERELKFLCSGDKGEKTSAYYLDFDFGHKKDWVLIHDLRLEHDGDVAQIDHLMIGRMMDVYVIESKNYTYGVSINEEGDFCYFHNKKPISIPSPISQNERHISLLDRFLTDNNLLPKRLGMTIKPRYRNIVLISPTSRLTKPKSGLYDCTAVMKGDKFVERFNNDINDDTLSDALNLTKVISRDSLEKFAKTVVLHHKPITIDYIAKFGLKDDEKIEEQAAEYNSVPSCPVCEKAMVQREVKKGKKAGDKFWGCTQYPKCRGVINIEKDKEEAKESTEMEPTCPKCDGAMVKRISKKGKNIGNEFWGCQSYPKCRGVVAIEEVIEKVVETEPTCPKCDGGMVMRVSNKGKNEGQEFWGCKSFPKCRGVVSIEINS